MTKQEVPVHETSGRLDPFRILSEEERRRHLDGYRSYLEVRNGEIDLDNRSLSRREAFMQALEVHPVVGQNLIDRDAMREHVSGPGATPIDEATAWLVAVARANEGEAYGVDLELRRFVRGKRFYGEQQVVMDDSDGTDLTQLYLFLEELYHSRILGEVCKACGFDLVIRKPRPRIRLLTRVIYHMPDRIRWTVILCGEVVGVAAFKLFLDRCHLFASEPEVEARLRSLISEIWRDELLHVALLRALLGPLALRVARRLVPFVLKSLLQDVPELLLVGAERGEIMRRVHEPIEIPRDLEWLKPDFAPAA